MVEFAAKLELKREKEIVLVEVHFGRLINQLIKYKKAIKKRENYSIFKTMGMKTPKYKMIIVFPMDDAEDIEIWGI